MWDIAENGTEHIELDRNQLTMAVMDAEKTLEFDARERTYTAIES